MMTKGEYFSEEEAKTKVGTQIRARVMLWGVPKGTAGRVTRADRVETGRYRLRIQWGFPEQDKPLRDWFSKTEYPEYLEELPPNKDGRHEEP